MADWANPTLTSTYTNFLSDLKARDEDLAKMFDGQTVSNVPTGAIRWSSSNNRFEKWSGTAWGELSTGYAINITGNAGTVTNGVYTTGNQTIGGSKTFTSEATVAGRVSVSGNGASLLIGSGRTASTGLSYIDLIAATGQEYGLRIGRAGGINGGTDLEHIGVGDFRLVASNAAPFKLVTNGLDRFVVDSSGNYSVYVAPSGFGVFSVFAQGTARLQVGNAEALINGSGDGQAFQWTYSTGNLFLRADTSAAITIRRSNDGSVVTFNKAGTALTGNIAISGTALQFNTGSDYRIKNVIEPVGDALGRVCSVPVHRFTYKDDPGRVRDGWLAHELQGVAPYAVMGEKDGEEYQLVDNSKVVPLLWAAVQELAKKLNSL